MAEIHVASKGIMPHDRKCQHTTPINKAPLKTKIHTHEYRPHRKTEAIFRL